ncbi:DNA helicase-2 / ATP-dependent DNA helicase PcrA [Natronoarchaeum philippinense]|uniref:DNA 3'-5' helicase n=1 Tax=Natronoarchaeum philippinense TaxID=558529 RepID=A0A285NWU6_NATPI|nr:ATP-dependent DNA helicase [Natronoarchaeum philippinense]SNZ12111.1 DNA helicase-2 / ATP-dependent DNA helicase PcrA [Natronoarchaeum philippinense]
MPDLTEDDFWTDSQRNVINHKEGPIQVIACAGSGKTQTIAARVAQMVHDGVDRDSIVAFTFTENAAEELQVRIRDMMDKANPENPILGDMFVGTVHGFCLDEVLHEFDPDTLSYDVLSDNQLSAFLSRVYPYIGLHEIGDDSDPPYGKTGRIQRFMKDIDAMRRELVEEEVRASNDPVAQDFIEVYDSFLEEMHDTHFYDFQGIIYQAIHILEENPEILEKVRNQFEYLIIDEYQDINFAQERLIELLAGEKKNICVVGDDDQSIFKWRGARTENFLEFGNRYDGEVRRLEQNFRSTSGIVDIAQDSIERNDQRLDKEMFSNTEPDIGDIYQNYFETDSSESEFIADKIQHHVHTSFEDPASGEERPLNYGDFAILFRRKRDMEIVQEELDDREIPYTVRGQESIFARPETEIIRLAIGFIARGHDDDIEVIDLEESGSSRFDETVTMSVSEEDLRQTIQQSEYLRDREDEIVSTLWEKRDWFSNPSSRRIHPQDELHDILAAMGMGDVESDISSDDEVFPEPLMYELGQVSKLFQDFEAVYEIIFPEQIHDLVQFLDYAAQNSNPRIEDPTLVNAVNLMTIHSAKGTEYPAVFMPGLSTYKFSTSSTGATRDTWLPDDVFDPDIYEEDTEDYRRLFYVGLTRAKKFLFLTGARENRGYEISQNPNQFFEEVESEEYSHVMDEVRSDPTPRRPSDSEAEMEDIVYPTSFTDLRYFQKCPYDYKMRHIYDFAPTIDSAFGYGFAVHDILREVHQRFADDEQGLLPSPGEIKQMVQNPDRFYLRHARGEVDQLLRDEAQRVLVDYVTEYSEDIPLTYKAEEPFEYLISGSGTNGEALISGEIDLLERRDPETGEIEEVNVLDFKTEQEPDSPHDPKLVASEFQVRLYAAATQSEFDLSTVDGYIHYLSDGERRTVDLSDSKLEQVERNVEQNVDNIMDREFFATPDKEKCGTCDFNDICPHAETE